MNTTFYLVRHRESEKNTLGIHHSKWVNRYPLTENGKQWAEDLITAFNWRAIDVVYSSPYLRCIETIEPLAVSRSLDIHFDDRITEIDVGNLDGKPVGDTWPRDRIFTNSRIWEVGESLFLCQRRMWDFIDEIAQLHMGKSILLCSHGEPLLFAKQYFLNFDYDDGPLRDSLYPAKDGFDECTIDVSWELISHHSYWKPQI